ncbi:hypothetical protein HBDW_45270 [Herbaspirillum sp. DW155]|uniref:hypothetical protein n=1 Tax=Herbaspirillum sp. DW155 TaxID=3095609 RepID=UPI00308C6BE8|nr:hypothetical protein HBDW_45270 [Herbaspirillum sp. DW155]
MTKANIYQIHYDEQTHRMLDPGFLPLDNSENPRPDWREYWPMRTFLLNNVINSDELYGFLSPAFRYKTNLSAEQVHAFINTHPGHDVYSISPLRQDSLCYLNVFEHGNRYHPGLIDITNEFLAALDIKVDFTRLAMDLRSTIFCNYFVAKPSFWAQWFALTEQLFAWAEDRNSSLGRKIDALTDYRQKSPLNMKVFIVERLASLILALDPSIKTVAYDIELMPWSNPAYIPYWNDMMTCNALKLAFMETRHQRYFLNFFALRNRILQQCEPLRADERSKQHFF